MSLSAELLLSRSSPTKLYPHWFSCFFWFFVGLRFIWSLSVLCFCFACVWLCVSLSVLTLGIFLAEAVWSRWRGSSSKNTFPAPLWMNKWMSEWVKSFFWLCTILKLCAIYWQKNTSFQVSAMCFLITKLNNISNTKKKIQLQTLSFLVISHCNP